MVPREPTEEMRHAGMEEAPLCVKESYKTGGFTGTIKGFSEAECAGIYKAMLSAAPLPEPPKDAR
jgi:hypothetical protein